MRTFGERMTAMEERLENLALILDVLLQAVGLIDQDGKWLNLEDDGEGMEVPGGSPVESSGDC